MEMENTNDYDIQSIHNLEQLLASLKTKRSIFVKLHHDLKRAWAIIKKYSAFTSGWTSGKPWERTFISADQQLHNTLTHAGFFKYIDESRKNLLKLKIMEDLDEKEVEWMNLAIRTYNLLQPEENFE